MAVQAAAIAAIVKKIIDEVLQRIPDPKARQEAEAELEKLAVQGQLAANAAEANHRSIFVAGWRPFIGWVGGTALAWTFVLKPLLTYVLALFGVATPLPELVATDQLMELIFGMLGFGAMRSFDKWKGTTHR